MDSVPLELTQKDIENWVNSVDLDKTDLRDLPDWLLESSVEKAGRDAEFGGRFLLCYAGAGCAEIVQQLLVAGVSPESAVQGIPAVFMAACLGHPEVIRILVAAGADADATRGEGVPIDSGKDVGRIGDTPLVGAVCRGFLDCVRVLLEVGADVNKADASESAPIHHAARKGQTEIVRILAEAGADLNRETDDVRTPLSTAIRAGNLEMIEVLLAAGRVDLNRLHDFEHHSNPPLIEAALLHNAAVVRMLLDAGADVGLANVSGCDALLGASSEPGGLAVVKLLVEAGADVDAVRILTYFTPLFIASLHGNLEVVRYLIEKGAKVDKPDAETGGTVLMSTCQGDQILTFFPPFTLWLKQSAFILPVVVFTILKSRGSQTGLRLHITTTTLLAYLAFS